MAFAAAGAGSDATAALSPVPDSTWQTNGRVRAIDYSRGVVYIGGSFTAVRPPGGTSGEVVRNHVAAFDARTGRLLRWNPNANGAVRSLVASRNTVYLGGSFTTMRGRPRAHAAAVNKRGALRRWSPSTNGPVEEIVRDRSGNVYLGGSFTAVDGRRRLRLARVGPGGNLHRWKASVSVESGPCPPECTPIVFALVLSRGGSTLYIGGRFGLVNGVPRRSAAAVSTTDGSTLAWNPNIISPTPTKPAQIGRVLDMTFSRSRAYLCGDFWQANGVRSANLVSVDLAAGNRIASFDANTDGGSPACQLKGGLVYVGGHFGQVGPRSGWVFGSGKATLTGPGTAKRVHVVAFDAQTGAIAPWNPGANSTLGVHALASGTGRLGVGGDFTRIGRIEQQGFAQFSAPN